MYRNLIPSLAVKYHVIAPDFAGFGKSDQPSPATFAYTFDHLAEATDTLLDSLRLDRYAIYVQDYGSPVGFRLFVKHPENTTAIITPMGTPTRRASPFCRSNIVRPHWKAKTPRRKAKVRAADLGDNQVPYTQASATQEHVVPMLDARSRYPDRPGNQEIQLALFDDDPVESEAIRPWTRCCARCNRPVVAVSANYPDLRRLRCHGLRAGTCPRRKSTSPQTGHFALEEDGT